MTLGAIAATGGVNVIELARSLDVIIKPSPECGVCGNETGQYEKEGQARYFDREGPKNAQVFVFRCGSSSCGALCGTTTCTLCVKPGEPHQQVLSKSVSTSAFYLPNLKPHERSDQRVAFSVLLLRSFTNDAVTIKSFDGWVHTYNSNAVDGNLYSTVKLADVSLNANTFRNAWFTFYAWEQGMALGVPPKNCALFTKRESDGDGYLERYIEDVNAFLSPALTWKWARHDESQCGIEHKIVVTDGHQKLHNECCSSKNATTLIHEALAQPLHLACARWPMFIDGKKMQMCGPCSLVSIVKDGAGDLNASADAIQEGFPELAIDDSDRALVGMTWYDAEDKQTYMFLGVTWMNVDSIDGRMVPELIAFYASTEDTPRCELVGTDSRTMFEKGALWSRMDEVRTWVSEDVKQVGMTDRAARKLRRDTQRATAAKQKPAATSKKRDGTAMQSDHPTMSHEEGWALEDIHSRVVHFNGSIQYEVSYVVQSKTIRIWEPAAAVPKTAVDRWLARRIAFRYTPEETELMKKCGGSLKENQPTVVSTSAGILVTILNCGIIISILPLCGAESLSQVFVHMVDLFDTHGDVLPLNLAYDDGCHLRRFAELRKEVSAIAMKFWIMVGFRIVIDRFHWKNHVKGHLYCQEHCNPSDNKDIEGANSEICEQSFRWFARHKYSVNHMSPARFLFFMLVIADKRNEFLIQSRK
jgi:hypothetical protein